MFEQFYAVLCVLNQEYVKMFTVSGVDLLNVISRFSVAKGKKVILKKIPLVKQAPLNGSAF